MAPAGGARDRHDGRARVRARRLPALPSRCRRRVSRAAAEHARGADLDRHPALRSLARLRLSRNRDAGDRPPARRRGALRARLLPHVAHAAIARFDLHRAAPRPERSARQRRVPARGRGAHSSGNAARARLRHGRRGVELRAASRHGHGDRLRLLRRRDRRPDRRRAGRPAAARHRDARASAGLARLRIDRAKRAAAVPLLPHLRAAQPLHAERALRVAVRGPVRRRGRGGRRGDRPADRGARAARALRPCARDPALGSRRGPDGSRRDGARGAGVPGDAAGAAARQAARAARAGRLDRGAGAARRRDADRARAPRHLGSRRASGRPTCSGWTSRRSGRGSGAADPLRERVSEAALRMERSRLGDRGSASPDRGPGPGALRPGGGSEGAERPRPAPAGGRLALAPEPRFLGAQDRAARAPSTRKPGASSRRWAMRRRAPARANKTQGSWRTRARRCSSSWCWERLRASPLPAATKRPPLLWSG